jgi:hypothetical protein
LTEVSNIHAVFISNYGIGVEWRWIGVRIDMNRMSKGMNRTGNHSRYEGEIKDEGIEWVIE